MALMTKSEFARFAKVSPAAITKAINAGKLVPIGTGRSAKINTDTPGVVTYLAELADKHRPGRTRRQRVPKLPITSYPPEEHSGVRTSVDDDDDEDMSDDDVWMNEAEAALIQRRKFELEKVKHQALHLKLKNAREIGTVVLREKVDRAVINPITTTFIRMMTDGSKTLAANVVPMVKGGSTVEEIEEHVRQHMSTLIKNLKKQMKKALEDPNAGT